MTTICRWLIAALLLAGCDGGPKFRSTDITGAPYGKALDLGCGSATWGVRLAARGWQVTGVDDVQTTVARAQERVREAEVDMRVVLGDVTRLQESAVGSDYDLVVDTGTFHGLTPAQRLDMGREVTAVAAKRRR